MTTENSQRLPVEHILTNKSHSANFKSASSSLAKMKFLQACAGLAQDKSVFGSRVLVVFFT
jgi:hypothetical protein